MLSANANLQKTDKKTDEKVPKTDKKTPRTDKKTDKKILHIMQNNPYVTISQLSDIIGVSQSAINQQIIKMRKLEIIRREGADKGGKWVIVNN